MRRPDGTVSELGSPGTLVGIVDEPHFETVHHRLGDDTLTLYTDGVTEARGEDGLYGEDRLKALLGAQPHDPHQITDAIARSALEFQDGEASDDIAIVTFAATKG